MTTIEDREESQGTEIRQFRFSRHALDEIERRRIPRDLAESVLAHPQQIVEEMQGMKAYQSKVDFGAGRMYLLRIIVDDGIEPATVVTAYRTSKVAKYWRES